MNKAFNRVWPASNLKEMADPFRIGSLALDDSGLPAPTPEVKQEREVAIFDLIEKNRFQLVARKGRSPPAGPYHLDISVKDGRLIFDVKTEDRNPITSFHLALTPFRQMIKDYFRICQAYFDAVKRLPPARIEAIDHGRRAMHDEGANLLIERLSGKIETDLATARRLFTLICVLHFYG